MKVIVSNGGSEFGSVLDHKNVFRTISDPMLVSLVESKDYRGKTTLAQLFRAGCLSAEYDIEDIVLDQSFDFARRFAELTGDYTHARSLRVIEVDGPFIIQSDGETGKEWVLERDKVDWHWPMIEAGTPRFFSPAVNPMFGDSPQYFWEDALCIEPMGPFSSEKEAREDYKKCRPDGEKTRGEDPGKEDKS